MDNSAMKEKYFSLSLTYRVAVKFLKEEIKILVEVNKTALPESYMRCSLKKDSLGAKNLVKPYKSPSLLLLLGYPIQGSLFS